MLVLAREIHDQCDLGFGDFIGKHAALAHAVLVDMHHNEIGVVIGFIEEVLQNVNNEFHRGEVVIQEKNAIERWLFNLRLGAGDDCHPRTIAILIPTGRQSHSERRTRREGRGAFVETKPMRRNDAHEPFFKDWQRQPNDAPKPYFLQAMLRWG